MYLQAGVTLFLCIFINEGYSINFTCRKIPTKTRMKNSNNKTVKKSDLPSKLCLNCNRPFTWRKKWEQHWEQVLYCSDACKKKKFTP